MFLFIYSNRFLQLIGEIMTLQDGKTLVFCQTKRRVDEIYRLTKQMGFPVVSFIF
jgi:superfamily II DNA/RNA helicase